MIGNFEMDGQVLRGDLSHGTCIAIPLNFTGPQPNHFGAMAARAEPMLVDGFVGDTRQGGSCNVPVLTINPHCNGTHTESVGHIVHESAPVHEAIPGGLIPATLISVTPILGATCGETYRPALDANDKVLTAHSLRLALRAGKSAEALVIRTMPNDPAKRFLRYGPRHRPAFFTIEAIRFLDSLGVKHLLVDLPSIDRTHDEGLLTAHHLFWNVPEGTHSLTATTHRDRTVSEMIFVPEPLPDGAYLLSLQIPAFSTDVAPSRPWLFRVV